MMLMLEPVASHEQKIHVTYYFEHLDLTNGMVSLMALLASCDTDTGSNGIP